MLTLRTKLVHNPFKHYDIVNDYFKTLVNIQLNISFSSMTNISNNRAPHIQIKCLLKSEIHCKLINILIINCWTTDT